MPPETELVSDQKPNWDHDREKRPNSNHDVEAESKPRFDLHVKLIGRRVANGVRRSDRPRQRRRLGWVAGKLLGCRIILHAVLLCWRDSDREFIIISVIKCVLRNLEFYGLVLNKILVRDRICEHWSIVDS